MNEGLCASCGARSDSPESCSACDGPVLLEDRFRLLKVVGEGAAGITYKAVDQQTGAPVAVKEMLLRHTTEPKVRAQMDREARVLEQLSHPQIPAYVAHFEAGSGKQRAFYLVQAFIEGTTLEEEMKGRRYTEAEVLDLLREVAGIFDYLHGLAPPVIHRDVKPGNLIRRPPQNGRPGALVLIDFGAVRDVLKDPATGGSTVAGTYGYMAPEQFKGEASAASDFYALGVLGVVLLSRKAPVDLVGVHHELAWRGAVKVSERSSALLEGLLKTDPEARLDSLAKLDGALRSPSPQPTALQPRQSTAIAQPERRYKRVAVALAVFGSAFGVHNFYLGNTWRGLLSVLFCWTVIPAFVSLFDALRLLVMPRAEFEALYNPAWMQRESADRLEALQKLQALRESGALSPTEFEREKARILGQGPSALPFGVDFSKLEAMMREASGLLDDPKRLRGYQRRWKKELRRHRKKWK